MYASAFVRMHAELCRDVRRHAGRHPRVHLNLNLNLDLNLVLYPALLAKPFEKSGDEPDASLFLSVIRHK